MYVTYKPESGDVQKWTFDPNRVRASKAEMIEKRFGESWDQWKAAVQTGNMKARRVLLWHLMTQDHPTLRWEDVPDFYAGELLVEYSAAELSVLRGNVERATLDPEQKEVMLAALDGEITEAAAREEARGVEAEGKAPSPSDANGMPSPSPKLSTSAPGSNVSNLPQMS